MGINRSSYYAWLVARPAAAERQCVEDELTEEIREIHASSRGAYGAPRVHAALRRKGHAVNRKKVERIMRERDIRGVTRRRHRHLTQQDTKAAPAPDLVGRDFTATRPGTKLVGSGSRRELPPPAPTEPCVTVSRYTALVTLSTRNGGQTASGRTSLGIAV
ncbi:IS3 family transposase [Streptomyces sp. NBC_01669]|uniref:IS3 family transposase n=1 Tax=Streptomyces sp. NBC_01669 TaxID=2975909 RepID=UPI00338EC8E5